MVTIEDMQAAVTALSSDNSITLPGLDFDTIVDNMVGRIPDYKPMFDQCKTKEQRDTLTKELVDYFHNAGRSFVDDKIIEIKVAYKNVLSGVKQIQEGLQTTVASILVPTVIGTAAPNPASILLESKIKKNTLLTMLDSVSKVLIDLLQAALKLFFVLPQAVIDIVGVLNTLRAGINLIKV